jgi:hypothetical protein
VEANRGGAGSGQGPDFRLKDWVMGKLPSWLQRCPSESSVRKVSAEGLSDLLGVMEDDLLEFLGKRTGGVRATSHGAIEPVFACKAVGRPPQEPLRSHGAASDLDLCKILEASIKRLEANANFGSSLRGGPRVDCPVGCQIDSQHFAD